MKGLLAIFGLKMSALKKCVFGQERKEEGKILGHLLLTQKFTILSLFPLHRYFGYNLIKIVNLGVKSELYSDQ